MEKSFNYSARSANLAQQKKTTKTYDKRILPPYGVLVDKYNKDNGLIVCTGSNAWQRAKSKTWIPEMPKVVLPLDKNPDCFKWPACGRHVMICGDGKPENYQRLIELSKCLLKQGAIWVLWVMSDYPLRKVERQSMEAVA